MLLWQAQFYESGAGFHPPADAAGGLPARESHEDK